MNFITKSKSSICFLLCITLVILLSFCLPDYSYAETDVVSTEVESLEKKTDNPEKGSEFDGFIVSIKDSKIDQVSKTEVAEETPSTESEKYYLIETTKEALELASASAITSVEPNYRRYSYAVYPPNDPHYQSLIRYSDGSSTFYKDGALKTYPAMGIDSLWNNDLHGEGVHVAVLDTGINSHVDMTAPEKILVSRDNNCKTVVASSLGNDLGGHGTMVTSVINAGYNNNKNIAGIADKAKITSINVFTKEGNEIFAYSWQTINAYEYLLKDGNTPDIMNCSYGGDGRIGDTENILLKELMDKDCIVIAANGNDGNKTGSEKNQLSYPANYPGVIGVGATNGDGNITSFSSKNTSVDVSAWGEYVTVLNPYDSQGTAAMDGTSFSSPIVAGIAACLKGEFPDMDSAIFLNLIQQTSTDKGVAGKDTTYGFGLINALGMRDIMLNSKTTITLNDRGVVTTKPYFYNNTLKNLPIPTRTGYTFSGWYTASSGGTKVTSSTIVKSPLTLYARWAPKSYTVKFSVNGGKSIKTKSKKITYDKSMESLPTPKRTGYNFLGWKSKRSGGTPYSKTKIWKETKGRTLYANWTKRKVVKYNANGGRISYYAKAVTKGKRYGTLAKPSRTGYVFKGWYTAKSGGKKITSKSKVKISKNHTIYARWKKK